MLLQGWAPSYERATPVTSALLCHREKERLSVDHTSRERRVCQKGAPFLCQHGRDVPSPKAMVEQDVEIGLPSPSKFGTNTTIKATLGLT